MNRILVIALAGIGDTLMATPVIHELRLRFPKARLEAVVLWPGAKEVLEGNPHLDAVHQHQFLQASKWASLRFVWGLRQPRADLSLNVHPQGRREYRAIAMLIGARRRLSHTYENQNWMDPWLVTDTIPQDYSIHCVQNNLNLLRRAEIEPTRTHHEYELYLSAAEKERAEGLVRQLGLAGRRWLGMHVGSGGTKNLALRRWPVSRYVEFIRRAAVELPGVPIVLFGGPGEREAHSEIRAAVGDVVLEPKTGSLRAAAAVLSHAWAFLSVDTVFMHLATAVQVPKQLVIETPTLNPPVQPYRADWTLIPNPAVGGRPLDFYRYDGRCIAGTDAAIQRMMESVSVDSVMAACQKAMASS